jgi:hypothetical protein
MCWKIGGWVLFSGGSKLASFTVAPLCQDILYVMLKSISTSTYVADYIHWRMRAGSQAVLSLIMDSILWHQYSTWPEVTFYTLALATVACGIAQLTLLQRASSQDSRAGRKYHGQTKQAAAGAGLKSWHLSLFFSLAFWRSYLTNDCEI